MKKLLISAVAVVGLSACTATTPATENVTRVVGPPVSNVTTPYDEVLACARDELAAVDAKTIGVSVIRDGTGQESYSEGGNGKYVTQEAGVIMQSAWYKMQPGATVNRQDNSVSQFENQLGRTLEIRATDAYVGGAITTIDFVPGGGFDIGVAGVGVKARQYRMAVGMNLSVTDTMTSEILADSAVFKEIVAFDTGFGIGRFFGDTLVTVDIGGQEREAVGFATREMLKYAAFDLATQVYDMPMDKCRAIADGVEDVNDLNGDQS